MRRNRKPLIVAGVAGAMSFMAIGALVANHMRTPITQVEWSSTKEGKLDIAWHDSEKTPVYTIYWSHKRGVRPKDPTTWTHSMQVTTLFAGETRLHPHYKASLHSDEEWVYFVIAKKGYRSTEFEAHVSQVDFRVENLDLRDLSRREGDRITYSVKVIPTAITYRISQYFDGGCHQYDHDVKTMHSTLLQFPRMEDSLVYISANLSGEWTPELFLF